MSIFKESDLFNAVASFPAVAGVPADAGDPLVGVTLLLPQVLKSNILDYQTTTIRQEIFLAIGLSIIHYCIIN
jgi:hypothetical protein